jgi:hypothetical protein
MFTLWSSSPSLYKYLEVSQGPQGPQGPRGTSAAPVAALVTGTASVTGMGSVATPGTDQLGMNRPEKRVKMSEAW